ncbi:FecR family protein [Opitutales bacterium]|nr:FecR family protein [Opitutales bacterium]
MRNLPFPLFLTFLFLFSCLSLHAIDSKGAIIIASMEGQITVTNNESGIDLASDRIKVGGLLFDGHTVKTGTGSKIVLLFSSGTITTLKEGSVLNIKKFAQKSFDPKTAGKLSARKDEPSPSETVIDLSLGDMVVDVKKLKKESSFNIDSPVGTAGIRGTIPRMKVVKLPGGGFNQTTQMLKGKISYMPKGGGRPTLLGPGQSLAAGISAAGGMLPMQIGRVPSSVMKAIQAEVDKAGAATGKAVDPPPAADTPQSNPEDDAPSDDELNEVDDDRQASAKGLDDNGSKEAIALEKTGLIDLENEDQAGKMDMYVEVAVVASAKFEEKVEERRSKRRASDGGKDDASFVSDLVNNFDDVVDVTIEAEAIGVKSDAMFDSLLEDSQNAADVKEVVAVASLIGAKDKESLESVFNNVSQADSVKEVVQVAADLGAQNKESLGSVFKNADKADDLNEVMQVAAKALGTDDGSGTKKLGSEQASVMASTLQNAEYADSMKSVMDDAASMGIQDGTNLTSVFQNADQADDLKEVMNVAKLTLGSVNEKGEKVFDSRQASILSATLQNADQASSVKSNIAVSASLGLQNSDSLTSQFQNADQAGSMKSNLEDAQELGLQDAANLATFFDNADQSDSLKAMMTLAKDTGAVTNLGTVLKNAEKATDLVTISSKAGGDGDLLNTVFASAEQATDLVAIVAAADEANLNGASVDVTNLLVNAEKATTLNELAQVASSAGGDDGKTDLLSEIFGNADKADDLAKVMAKSGGDIETQKAILRSAEQAESLAQAVDDADASADPGSGPADFTNFLAVVKQVDKKKQRAKALEIQSGGLDVDASTRDAITAIDSVSALKSKLKDLLPTDVSSEVADRVFRAKDLDPTTVDGVTPTSVQSILDEGSYSDDVKTTVRDLWVVVSARKEALISDQGFQNIKTLTDIAAGSGDSSAAVLDTALENVEQVNQLKVLIDAGGDDSTLLDQLATGGDSFDFDEVMESGALTSLKSSRFVDQGYSFNELFSTDSATPQTLVTDYSDQTAVDTYLTANSINAKSVVHSDGSSIYDLTADQVNLLTGSSTGVAGTYKFDEVTDADTGAVSGVTLSTASKILSVSEFSNFSLSAERAGDVLFVLDSPVLKANESDSADQLAKKEEYRELFLNNADQIDNLIEIGKVLGEDEVMIDVVFSNLSLLDDLTPLAQNLRNKPAKLNYVFNGVSGEIDQTTKAETLSMFNSLVATYLNQPAKLDKLFLEENFDYLPNIYEISPMLDAAKGQVDLLFNNLDKSEDLLLIAQRYEGTKKDSVLNEIQNLSRALGYDADKRDAIFDNPSQVASLTKLYNEFKADLEKINVIFEHADKADSFLEVLNELKGPDGSGSFEILFSDTLLTMEKTGLAKLSAEYPEYIDVFIENSDIAAEIASTASKFKGDPEKLDLVFSNIDKLDQINDFANELGGYETITNEETGEAVERFIYDIQLMDIFFNNLQDLDRLISFKSIGERVGIPGGDAMEIFDLEPEWLNFVTSDSEVDRDDNGRIVLRPDQLKAAKFLGDLYASEVPISSIPVLLAKELMVLNLSREELSTVLSDLIDGPLMEEPGSEPPSDDDPSAANDLKTLSFLLDHKFTGTIDPNLVISADVAMASSFFKETMDVYESLSLLGESIDEYTPENESDIIDSNVDGSFNPSDTQLTDTETEPVSPSHDTSDYDDFEGVLGGRNLSFGSGTYDLSQLSHNRLLIASSERLNLAGSLSFTVDQTDGVINELKLLSAGGITFEKGTEINYGGDSLGIGSFNSLNVIGVDLYAQDQISLRSLDRLVLNNVSMNTNGQGNYNEVELLAHQEISVDNLRFNEHVRRIAMEAMTLNLRNLNFPAQSKVMLNSAYGPINGKYPNFNSSIWGRVNFITNIRYANDLIMTPSAFDAHGSNITIGKIGH